MPKCSVSSCNQRACLASGEELLCGDHWRDIQADREKASAEANLYQQIERIGSWEDVKEVLHILADK